MTDPTVTLHVDLRDIHALEDGPITVAFQGSTVYVVWIDDLGRERVTTVVADGSVELRPGS